MWFFKRRPVVPVVRFSGPIGFATPLRPGLSISAVAAGLDKAFSLSKLPSVAVIVNSPGGSPVQSNLIFKRIRQLAEEKKKKVYVFCEDVAASGGYYLAVAGDEIYADPSSIVGSIGVISATFGFDKAIARLGIERRVYTAGESKALLDPFQEEKPEDVERLRAIQKNVHDVFIGIVKDRRAPRLKGLDTELFSGAFWSAAKALDFGLIDGVSDVRTKMRELHGDDVQLKVVPFGPGGWLSRLFRFPRLSTAITGSGAAERLPFALADDLLSAIEARAIWSRYGL